MNALTLSCKAIALIGTLTSSIYCAMVFVAAYLFNSRRPTGSPIHTSPDLSVLKPLHGIQPGLRSNLESHFIQDYLGEIELIFCARHNNDEGLTLAKQLAAQYPHVPCKFLTCGEPQFPNAKAYSLYVMEQAAQHDLLVTTDADVRVPQDFLTRSVSDLQSNKADLVFCLYRGVSLKQSLALQLDALGKTVDMASGALVSAMLNGVDFALGPSMIFTRRALREAGGFKELGEYWAEDFVFGNRLYDCGRDVVIAGHTVELIIATSDPWESLRDQLRWAQSTRRSRPWGHLGSGLTFAVPYGVLGFLGVLASGTPLLAASLLLLSILNRVLQGLSVCVALRQRHPLRAAALYPFRDILGFLIWICSYLPLPASYYQDTFRILPDGRIARS